MPTACSADGDDFAAVHLPGTDPFTLRARAICAFVMPARSMASARRRAKSWRTNGVDTIRLKYQTKTKML